jgi:hypothetical protein
MSIVNNYLKYIQELWEKPEIKKSKGPVYLYHGTRNTPEQIKRRGLTIKDNGSNEGERTYNKKVIWFTSSKKYASQYTRETHILSEKVGLVVKCKLDKKYLRFLERPLNLFDEYIYFKDIPPKDIKIVWDAKKDQKIK